MPATGPVTVEGKARSSQNALRHGLTAGKFVLLPDEDPDEFAAACERLRQEWQPASDTQAELVERFAVQHWRLMRAIALESRLQADPDLDDEAHLKRVVVVGRYVRG